MLYSIVKYWHTFVKKDEESGKHGIVAWLASGTIFDVQGSGQLGSGDGANIGWLPNFGAGYRLELQPRMNMRLDFGIGLYEGPEAPEGKESNCIQTNPEESWFTYFRCYGPLKPFFE